MFVRKVIFFLKKAKKQTNKQTKQNKTKKKTKTKQNKTKTKTKQNKNGDIPIFVWSGWAKNIYDMPFHFIFSYFQAPI